MHIIANALVGSCITSIVPVGLLLVYDPENQAINVSLIALAIGSLLGDAALHLIPEMLGVGVKQCMAPAIALLVGMFVFLSFEQYLQMYHCGHGHARRDSQASTDAHRSGRDRPLGPLVVTSDLVHNLVDGLAIGTSFRASVSTGLSTTVAVLLHEIPHELSDYAILGASGYGRREIVVCSMIASSASVAGAVLGAAMGNVHVLGHPLQPLMLAFTAGNFLYIALADMVPELLHGHTPLAMPAQSLLMALGAALMLLLKWEFN